MVTLYIPSTRGRLLYVSSKRLILFSFFTTVTRSHNTSFIGASVVRFSLEVRSTSSLHVCSIIPFTVSLLFLNKFVYTGKFITDNEIYTPINVLLTNLVVSFFYVADLHNMFSLGTWSTDSTFLTFSSSGCS